MATINLLLKTNYKCKDGTYSLIIRVCHGHKQLQHYTGYKLLETQFKNGEVVKHPDAFLINEKVGEKVMQARRYIADCRERGRPIDFKLIFRKKQSYSFIEYLKEREQYFKSRDMIIMKQKAARFAFELTECFGDIHFDEIGQSELEKYEAWLIKQGNGQNTRNKKFEFLGKFFSDASRAKKTYGDNPFSNYKIKKLPVYKTKLTPEQIKAIEDLPLAPGPVNDARNIFLFSYYARGMRFENCVILKRENIRDDRIYNRANKSKRFMSLRIHSRLQKIIDQYAGEFVFPYLKEIPESRQKYVSVIGSANAIVNRHLKTVAELAGITEKVSMHTARHSFAWHLKYKTGSINVISDALGHSSSKVTEVYLKSLDDEFLDHEMSKLYGD